VNRLIAERLFIAETTVKGHVSRLLDKLEASSRLQAVVLATEHGLL
jgi:DNA-binding NarL/FixJ family response regulator